LVEDFDRHGGCVVLVCVDLRVPKLINDPGVWSHLEVVEGAYVGRWKLGEKLVVFRSNMNERATATIAISVNTLANLVEGRR
jgi:hypothetical protein